MVKAMSVLDLYVKLQGIKLAYGEQAVSKMPVYIGDDEELNGVHQSYGVDVLSYKTMAEAGIRTDGYLTKENPGTILLIS